MDSAAIAFYSVVKASLLVVRAMCSIGFTFVRH
jgi:hypothetical protein